MIATACKATLPSHALIRLYDTRTWQPIKTIVPQGGVLEGHSLTITKLAFSGNDRWLLSVSRDRSWRIYERVEAEKEAEEELGTLSKPFDLSFQQRLINRFERYRLSTIGSRIESSCKDHLGCVLEYRYQGGRELVRYSFS